MKAVVSLTPEESKRLIAKAIVDLDIVQKAKAEGFIGLARCSSAGYVVEELLDRRLNRQKAYLSGFISDRGLCATQAQDQEKLLVLKQGEEIWLDYTQGNVANYIDAMGCHDVIIKSGSVIDPDGNAGCLVAAPNGGEIGIYLPHILAKGINLIVPMTLNKTIAFPLGRIVASLGISKLDEKRCQGLLCGMMPLPGLVVTEIEAIRRLTGAEALPIAVNGIGSGAGSIALVIDGSSEKVDRAWDLIQGIRAAGEPTLTEPPSPCDDCYLVNNPELGARCATFKPND